MVRSLNGVSIAFDLDGTLVDTAPDLVRALNAAARPDGLDPIPISEVRNYVGRGARVMIARAFEHAGKPLSEQEIEARLDIFMATYRAGIADESRPFPGVVEALDALSARGAALSVCTNKTGALARQLLEALGLSTRFERIIGGDEVPAKKPDPGHLLTALGPGADPARAVMVGDSEPDALAARGAGAKLILFSEGYTEKPAERFNPDRLIADFADLETAIDSVLALSPPLGGSALEA